MSVDPRWEFEEPGSANPNLHTKAVWGPPKMYLLSNRMKSINSLGEKISTEGKEDWAGFWADCPFKSRLDFESDQAGSTLDQHGWKKKLTSAAGIKADKSPSPTGHTKMTPLLWQWNSALSSLDPLRQRKRSLASCHSWYHHQSQVWRQAAAEVRANPTAGPGGPEGQDQTTHSTGAIVKEQRPTCVCSRAPLRPPKHRWSHTVWQHISIIINQMLLWEEFRLSKQV